MPILARTFVLPDPANPERVTERQRLSDVTEQSLWRGIATLATARHLNEVGEAIELGKRVTPRAMRRSYQDLARAAEMKDLVTRAISGHAGETEEEVADLRQQVDKHRVEMGDMQERLDFAERLLAQPRDADRLQA